MAEEQTNGNGEGQPLSPQEWLAQQQQAQEEPADVEVDVETDDPGLLQSVGSAVGDVAQGVADGVQRGAVETAETIGWVGDQAMFAASEALTGEAQNYYVGEGWLTREEVEEANRSGERLGFQPVQSFNEATDIPAPDTVAGSLASGISQFVAGYGVAGKALKGFKAATKSGQYGKAMIQGGIADFMSFDEHEVRFSDFLRDQFGLQNAVTEFLAADEDDTVLEGKLKNTIEGFGLGLATDAVFRLTKAMRRARRVQADQGDEAAAEVMNEELADLADEGQFDLFDEASDPNLGPRRSAEPEVSVSGSQSGSEVADDLGPRRDYSPAEAEAEQRLMARQKAPDFDTEDFQRAVEREVLAYRDTGRPRTSALEGDYFNWDKMDSDLTTKDYVRMATEAIPDDAIPASTTFKQMESDALDFLAESVDGSPDDIRSYLRRTAQDAEAQPKALLGGKMLMQSLGREIEQLAFKLSAGKGTPLDYNKFQRLNASYLEIVADVKSVQKSAAQTTAAGRIHTTDVVSGEDVSRLDILRQLEDELQNHGGGRRQIDDLANEIVMARKANGTNTSVLRVLANRSRAGQFWQVVNEIRINGLLSGPQTHAINALSNGIQMGLLPMERAAGGLVRGDMARAREGFAMYQGLALAVKDSFKFAKMAGWKGRNILDPEAAILEANGVDFRAIQSTSSNPVARTLIDSVGNTIRLPSRFLSVGDEFFKQMNYRAELYGRLTTQASDLVASGKIDASEASQWIEKKMRAGIGRDGRARDMDALSYARETTFTNELRAGSAPRAIQNMSNAHPWMKILVPFVRTPTNLIVAGVQRTPLLRRLSKNLMDDMRSGDPSRMASAKGKVVSGNILWGTAVIAALEGKITGGGPTDPAARKRKLETGWKPYSYVRETADGGKEYVEYSRLDPFAMFFGIAADVAEIGGQTDEQTMEEIGKAALVAFANNVGSKTWLQGITDAAEAYANPEMHMSHYLNRLATSFIPYSSALRTARQAQDPYMREVESLVQAVKNTIPGYSDNLPARRSMITGEPIVYPKGWGDDLVTPLGEAFASANPISATDWKEDRVLDELANLGEGVTGYPRRKIMGVEMTPEQYSRYIELHGVIRNPGTKRTLYQELDRLFQSPMYDIERERAGDPDDPALNARIKMVRRVITRYREAAKQQLFREFPELGQDVRQREAEAIGQQRGLASGIIELGE